MKLPIIFWETKNLLLQHLANARISVLIGEDVESPVRYVSCSVTCWEGSVEIGIFSNQVGNDLCCWLLSRCNRLLVGHDQEITVVDLSGARIINSASLEGLFFEFVIESTIGQILAIHELGVLALSQDAEFRWRFIAPDILTGWQITEENIRLSIMDSDYIELDKLRGRQL